MPSNLQELYTDRGLLSGAVEGLSTGANLGKLFADTASTEQDTLKKQQMLPLELAQAGASLDKDVMANDLTRSIQSPEYLKQKGANAVSEEQVKGMTMEQAAKLLPFETFNKMMVQQSTNSAQMLSSMADAIDAGRLDDVYQQLRGMTKDSNALRQIDQEYTKAKANPKAASQQLRQRVFQISSGINEANGPMQQQRWIELLKGMMDMNIAKISASAKNNQGPNPSIDSELVYLSRKLSTLQRGTPEWNSTLERYNFLNNSKRSTETDYGFGLPPQKKIPNVQGAAPNGLNQNPDGLSTLGNDAKRKALIEKLNQNRK